VRTKRTGGFLMENSMVYVIKDGENHFVSGNMMAFTLTDEGWLYSFFTGKTTGFSYYKENGLKTAEEDLKKLGKIKEKHGFNKEFHLEEIDLTTVPMGELIIEEIVADSEETTKELIKQIQVDLERDILEIKTISAEEFLLIFNERFNERAISISYSNNFVSPGITYEEATITRYADNTIHFYESDGEVPYDFSINLNGLNHIEMIDDVLDMGAQFIFVGNDGSKISIDAGM
jgi:hypothetical protein